MPNEQEDIGSKYALKDPESKSKLSMSDVTEKRKAEIHITLNSITQLYVVFYSNLPTICVFKLKSFYTPNSVKCVKI